MTVSKIIFTEGKELAMKSLFDANETYSFSWIAIGNSPTGQGFENSQTPGTSSAGNGFVEIEDETYSRIPLKYKSTDIDNDSGKVTVMFEAQLDYQNIITSTTINQLAVVDNGQRNNANTKFYSATTFPSFTKNSQNAMTFVIGFRF